MEANPNRLVADAACERCGSFDVLEIAGQFLCGECVATAGCGCAGHGKDVVNEN